MPGSHGIAVHLQRAVMALGELQQLEGSIANPRESLKTIRSVGLISPRSIAPYFLPRAFLPARMSASSGPGTEKHARDDGG